MAWAGRSRAAGRPGGVVCSDAVHPAPAPPAARQRPPERPGDTGRSASLVRLFACSLAPAGARNAGGDVVLRRWLAALVVATGPWLAPAIPAGAQAAAP